MNAMAKQTLCSSTIHHETSPARQLYAAKEVNVYVRVFPPTNNQFSTPSEHAILFKNLNLMHIKPSIVCIGFPHRMKDGAPCDSKGPEGVGGFINVRHGREGRFGRCVVVNLTSTQLAGLSWPWRYPAPPVFPRVF